MKSGKLWIRTKTGEIKPFIPNFAQKIVLEVIEKRIAENKPVRIRLLKARQLGFSTLFEAIIYAFTSRREGFHSLVVADDEEGSQELFEMNKLYHEKLEEEFKPQLKKSNEIALEFTGLKSRIEVETSRNKNAGRGSTFQIVHKSETSRFHFPKEVNLGIANAVPDLPGTMVFDETTANGMNFYYDDVQKSINSVDGYEFIFIPWVMNPDYKMPASEFERTLEEQDIAKIAQEKYNITLSDEQLSWRRYAIAHKCSGDISLFKQEYPLTAEEAFIYSGRPRFDVDIVKELIAKSAEPFLKDGVLDIYEGLDPTAKYVIGVDTSEGLDTGDCSSAVILNAKRYTIAAHYSGKVPPDVLASYLKTWGEKYNNALIVVECNNHGLVSLNFLKEIYKNLYYRRIFDKISNEEVQKIGWQTSARTKPLLIANLDKAIRSGLSIRSRAILNQLLSYVIAEDGTTNASEGKHDDDVIALALAVQGYLEMGEREIPLAERVPANNSLAKHLESLKPSSNGTHQYEGFRYRYGS